MKTIGMRLYYLIGKTVHEATTIDEWSKRYKHAIVGFSEIGEYCISTVFIGMDHRNIFSSDPDVAEPYLFETMVSANGIGMVGMERHSSTWEDAHKHHKLTCWSYFDMLSEED